MQFVNDTVGRVLIGALLGSIALLSLAARADDLSYIDSYAGTTPQCKTGGGDQDKKLTLFKRGNDYIHKIGECSGGEPQSCNGATFSGDAIDNFGGICVGTFTPLNERLNQLNKAANDKMIGSFAAITGQLNVIANSPVTAPEIKDALAKIQTQIDALKALLPPPPN